MLSIFFTGCETEEVGVYSEGITGIFFQYLVSYTMDHTPISYADSMKYSFANANLGVEKAVRQVPVLITGNTAPYDRPIRVTIDEERTTAVRGTHFEIDTDTIYLPANSSRAYVPVTLIRHPDLLTRTLSVTLKLEENEHFKIMVDAYKSLHAWTAGGVKLDATRFRVIFTESYTLPDYWTYMTAFGEYSVKKYLFVNSLMGWTAEDWKEAGNAGAKIASGKANFVAGLMQKELQKMADQGEPLVDENGDYVQLPDPYQVDYSRFE